MRVAILGDSYEDDARIFSSANYINCRVEIGPETSRNVGKVRGCWGVVDEYSIGGTVGARRLLRHEGDGILYAVAGSKLYSLSADGTVKELGTLSTSTERVYMIAGGKTSSNNQLLILDGVDSYTYDAATDTFAIIPNATLPGAVSGCYLEGYYIVAQSQNSDTFEISGLDNPNVWLAEQTRASATAAPIVGLAANHGELWVMCSTAIEVWTNTGNIDFPFEYLDGTLIERGLFGKFAFTTDDNTIFWVGDDRIVYRADGYAPLRISNHSIEQALGRVVQGDFDSVWLSSHTEDGHKMITLAIPSVNKFYQHCVETGFWCERKSFGQDSWRCNDIVEAYNKVYQADSITSAIGSLDKNVFTEFSNTMQMILITSVVHAEQMPFILDRLEGLFEAGFGDLSGEGADPQVMLFISKDGGNTYGDPLVRNLGGRGQYGHRTVWRQLGQHRNSVFKFVITDPVRRTIIDLVAEVEPLDI